MCNSKLVIGTWADVTDGCPMKWSVSGSDVAHLMIGEGRFSFEINLDSAAMRECLESGTAALAEMDARYEKEESRVRRSQT